MWSCQGLYLLYSSLLAAVSHPCGSWEWYWEPFQPWVLPVHVGCCAEHEALAVLTTSIYTPKRLADMWVLRLLVFPTASQPIQARSWTIGEASISARCIDPKCPGENNLLPTPTGGVCSLALLGCPGIWENTDPPAGCLRSVALLRPCMCQSHLWSGGGTLLGEGRKGRRGTVLGCKSTAPDTSCYSFWRAHFPASLLAAVCRAVCACLCLCMQSLHCFYCSNEWTDVLSQWNNEFVSLACLNAGESLKSGARMADSWIKMEWESNGNCNLYLPLPINTLGPWPSWDSVAWLLLQTGMCLLAELAQSPHSSFLSLFYPLSFIQILSSMMVGMS